MKGKRLRPMQVLMKVWEVDWKEVGKAGFPPGFGSSCVIGFTLQRFGVASPSRVAAKEVMAACVRVVG